MKKLIGIFVFLFSMQAFADLVGALDEADKELNASYKKLYEKLEKNARKKLKNAESEWIDYRDENCAFEAESLDPNSDHVSKLNAELDRTICLLRLTKLRNAELDVYNEIIFNGGSKDVLGTNEPIFTEKITHLHVIGVYEGQENKQQSLQNDQVAAHSMDSYARQQNEEGIVNIKIKRNVESKSVVLVLLSHDPVHWIIDNPEHVKIEKIYLGSEYSGSVSGADDVPVLRESSNDLGLIYNRSNLPRIEAQIKAITGLPVTSFQGNYSAGQFEIF